MHNNFSFNPSPIQPVKYNGFKFLIKRDDLIDEYFSGNKARKLSYFVENNFTHIDKIISYGSVQSNLLLSLAALANLKQWQLNFYVQNIPNWLANQPIGNFAKAIELGAKIIPWKTEGANSEHSSINDFIQVKKGQISKNTLFIPEGARCKQAKSGIKQLADEIEDYCHSNSINKLLIMLPSGTGTTALFLNSFLRHSKLELSVVTCPCVGDESYLKKQFLELSENQKDWPIVLPTAKKYHFGKLYVEHFELWQELKNQMGIEFELLYDPIGWRSLLNYLENEDHQNVLYIHQGGLIGNQSMLPRYSRINN